MYQLLRTRSYSGIHEALEVLKEGGGGYPHSRLLALTAVVVPRRAEMGFERPSDVKAGFLCLSRGLDIDRRRWRCFNFNFNITLDVIGIK